PRLLHLRGNRAPIAADRRRPRRGHFRRRRRKQRRTRWPCGTWPNSPPRRLGAVAAHPRCCHPPGIAPSRARPSLAARTESHLPLPPLASVNPPRRNFQTIGRRRRGCLPTRRDRRLTRPKASRRGRWFGSGARWRRRFCGNPSRRGARR
ncbi:unnamed protein product, partial [Ectocarpus sp. 12 AP-2014]